MNPGPTRDRMLSLQHSHLNNTHVEQFQRWFSNLICKISRIFLCVLGDDVDQFAQQEWDVNVDHSDSQRRLQPGHSLHLTPCS